jgi:hypothetical protein
MWRSWRINMPCFLPLPTAAASAPSKSAHTARLSKTSQSTSVTPGSIHHIWF